MNNKAPVQLEQVHVQPKRYLPRQIPPLVELKLFYYSPLSMTEPMTTAFVFKNDTGMSARALRQFLWKHLPADRALPLKTFKLPLPTEAMRHFACPVEQINARVYSHELLAIGDRHDPPSLLSPIALSHVVDAISDQEAALANEIETVLNRLRK